MLDARLARVDWRPEVHDLARKADFTGIGDHRSAKRFNQRRLSGAVIAPITTARISPAIEFEVGVIERGDAPVALDELSREENGFDAHLSTLRIHWSRADRDDDQHADGEFLPSTSRPASDTAERNTPTISAPISVPTTGAAAAEQTPSAANHHGGDAVEVGVLAGGRADARQCGRSAPSRQSRR